VHRALNHSSRDRLHPVALSIRFGSNEECDVRTELTPAEIEAYQRDGFVLIRGFLDRDEVERWREVIGRASDARGSSTVTDLFQSTADPSPGMKAYVEYYNRVFDQRMNLWQVDEAARSIVVDPAIGKMAATLAGTDGIRLFHDQSLFKQPWGNPTAFHLDDPYWSFTSPDAISLWVALDEVTAQNGALLFVPGTHKTARADNVGIGKELGALFDLYPEWTEIEPVLVEMEPGDASFHNGLTAHGAGANLTPRPRRAMTWQMMPDGATYNGNPNILPPDYVATLEVGDALANDDVNPLLWSRKSA